MRNAAATTTTTTTTTNSQSNLTKTTADIIVTSDGNIIESKPDPLSVSIRERAYLWPQLLAPDFQTCMCWQAAEGPIPGGSTELHLVPIDFCSKFEHSFTTTDENQAGWEIRSSVLESRIRDRTETSHPM